MSKKKAPVEKQLCCDCIHSVPVTKEHLAYDGSPIFCTCAFKPKYNFLRYREQAKGDCQYFEHKPQ